MRLWRSGFSFVRSIARATVVAALIVAPFLWARSYDTCDLCRHYWQAVTPQRVSTREWELLSSNGRVRLSCWGMGVPTQSHEAGRAGEAPFACYTFFSEPAPHWDLPGRVVPVFENRGFAPPHGLYGVASSSYRWMLYVPWYGVMLLLGVVPAIDLILVLKRWRGRRLARTKKADSNVSPT